MGTRDDTRLQGGKREDRKHPDNSATILTRLCKLKFGDHTLKRKYNKVKKKCAQVNDIINYKMGALVLIEFPGKTTWNFCRPSSSQATGMMQVTARTGTE